MPTGRDCIENNHAKCRWEPCDCDCHSIDVLKQILKQNETLFTSLNASRENNARLYREMDVLKEQVLKLEKKLLKYEFEEKVREEVERRLNPNA